jgi:copper chaperone CopZ
MTRMGGEETRGIWAMGGVALGVAAAILSCVSPVMTLFAGDADLAYSSARPYLQIAAFALLGLAFLLIYRVARAAVREGEKASGRLPSVVWSWRILWVATALVFASASFPYYSGRLVRTMGRVPYLGHPIKQRATARVVLSIEGMDCPICAAGLQSNLRQIPGVRRAEVSFQDKQADLEYDPDIVKLARFAEVVADAGFKLGGVVARTD